jgi:phosphate/phosphite/phosphonate ABC transporter binding protein
MNLTRRHAASLALGAPLKFGVGMFQPDREKNDATYRPLAEHLAQRLGRPVELRTVDSWEGLAKSLANGETDIALMGPWGYVLANHLAGAQVVSTILYQGKPEYFAMIVTHPGSGMNSIDLMGPKGKGRTFAFGDKGSTSGYLIPYCTTSRKVASTRKSTCPRAAHQAPGHPDAGHARPARRRRRLQPQPRRDDCRRA